jgi:hypothetical protein
MPTKDGKRPLIKDIAMAEKELEYKINNLITQFRTTYNPPAVKMRLITIDHDYYTVFTRIDAGILREQYNTSEENE